MKTMHKMTIPHSQWATGKINKYPLIKVICDGNYKEENSSQVFKIYALNLPKLLYLFRVLPVPIPPLVLTIQGQVMHFI